MEKVNDKLTDTDIQSKTFDEEMTSPTIKPQEKIFVITKMKKQKNWNKAEDMLLLELATKFRGKSWTKISMFFTNKNPPQCRARYKRIRPGIVKGAWTNEEDQKLINLVQKSGKNWALISKLMPSRSGKQIRDRFLNNLDPNLSKNKFSEEEDKIILENYLKFGSKWSLIAKKFEGKTGDMVKNRFYSCLKRKIHIYEVNYNTKIKSKKKLSKTKIVISDQATSPTIIYNTNYEINSNNKYKTIKNESYVQNNHLIEEEKRSILTTNNMFEQKDMSNDTSNLSSNSHLDKLLRSNMWRIYNENNNYYDAIIRMAAQKSFDSQTKPEVNEHLNNKHFSFTKYNLSQNFPKQEYLFGNRNGNSVINTNDPLILFMTNLQFQNNQIHN